jgi:hypothetical protein
MAAIMFATTYLQARRDFRSQALALGAEVQAIEIEAGGQRAEDGSLLSIEVASFGRGPRALVISSGLHGVEGFAGSAIQSLCMQRAWPQDRRLVLLHALNPAGMSSLRRVNENNVDLNRNFLAPGELYRGSPEHYGRLDGMLNPKRPVSALEFNMRSAWQIARFGYGALKQAIAGGQYDYPEGLFWGGDRLQEGPEKLLAALPGLFSEVEQIDWVDVHTGLGVSGEPTYLVEASKSSASYQKLRKRFGERVQAWDEDDGVAYAIRGGFPGGLKALFGDRLTMLTCEFGTIKATRVLRNLISDNRIYHCGGNAELAATRMRDAFDPQNEVWRELVLRRAGALLDVCFDEAQD